MKIAGQNIQKIIPLAALIFAFMLSVSSCERDNTDTVESYTYYTLDEVNQFIEDAHTANPSITEVEQVGTSVDGRAINALVISSYSGSSTGPASLEMEPRVRISAGIHGNEKVTAEVLVRYTNYLLSEFNNGSTEITDLVNTRYIVIIPVINPDGYTISRRYNANGVDLNRNFSRGWSDESPVYGTAAFSEPESLAVSQYTISKRFTTGITLHSGTVIVNMPFDYTTTLPVEDDLVQEFGRAYSKAGTFLSNPDILADSDVIDGTVFGALWYYAYGTMQDWSYIDAGCLDYTVEIAESKYPVHDEDIEETYGYNRDSLTAFIKKSGYGVYGRVTESDGITPIADVKITIPGGDLVIYTDTEGYYHRLLLDGTYDLSFEITGYTTVTETVTVDNTDSGTKLDVQMN